MTFGQMTIVQMVKCRSADQSIISLNNFICRYLLWFVPSILPLLQQSTATDRHLALDKHSVKQEQGTVVDASVLQWGQIKTLELFIYLFHVFPFPQRVQKRRGSFYLCRIKCDVLGYDVNNTYVPPSPQLSLPRIHRVLFVDSISPR